ncbi:ubiquitin-protein ligase molybdopterin-converting factor [Sodiomyces alkalinus F11]|uniref:Ubiquitin-protein ligase molybdopterin-converting factor n=1 Tax=Sodiomyces alkalinus (strain CBS 110278 / VKM F-3762 / F11) TaxID=1314773 RepID=A0A3N2PLJ8_SODAK|nr:ubiquitin-protein ligase molybdopterin-converting factor [Sodiomyces alkalinus F11]ROT35398.1 ubiquitin-protein ligase molybdopterin-converting factor [Sodiomyces alkalinus F11]
MSSFLSKAASDPRVQLATTAIISGATVACLIFGYQSLAREERLDELKRSIPPPTDTTSTLDKVRKTGGTLPPVDKEDARNEALARRAQAGDFDDELILEQLARNRVFLKDEGLEKLRKSFVIVVGCGGVGSHCTAALARSGVSKIRLIDFDQVTLSSLNRHAAATLADVGMPKVQCLYRRLIAVTPWVKFDLRLQKFEGDVADDVLSPWTEDGQPPDFVVDAIDNIDTKVALLKYCHDRKIPVISSMGAGAKSDPTRIMIGDIGTSTDDGLSRATRRRLKLQGVTSGIPVVYSNEKAGEGKAELLPLPEDEFQKGKVGDLGVLPNFRVRILPVLGTMPAVFGYTVANYIILSITGYPLDNSVNKNRDKMYDGILGLVQASEERLVRYSEGTSADLDVARGLRLPLTPGDVAFLVEELYKGRSAITGVPTRLSLVRWRKPEGTPLIRIGEGLEEQKSSNVRLGDLVCMTKDEASRHEKTILMGVGRIEDLYDEQTISKVEERIKEAQESERYRS